MSWLAEPEGPVEPLLDRAAVHIAADQPGATGGQATKLMAHYLAVTAVLEMHLGCVLNYWQPDGRHRSHWHLDDHREPGWSPQWKPSVRFLQAALRYVWGAEGLAIDGDCGPKSKAALAHRAALGVDGLEIGPRWRWFLEETARRGFGTTNEGR